MVDEPPRKLIKVKIKTSKPPSESPPQYVYHWDRIIGALAALMLLIGLIGYGLYTWLRPSLPPASVEIRKPRAPEELILGTAQQPESSSQRPVSSSDQPAQGKTAAEVAETDSALSKIGKAAVTASGPAQVQAEPVSARPRPPEEGALEVEARRPVGAKSTPQIAATEQPRHKSSAETVVAEPQPLSARDEPTEPEVVKTTDLESSDEEQEVKIRSPAREDRAESSAGDTPVLSAKVGTDRGRETAASPAAPDASADESDKGALKLGETSIASPAVKRFLLTRSMAGNEPSGTLDDVTLNAKGYAEVSSFSEVVDLEGEVLQYRWLYEGEEVLRIRVPVAAKRWRSHSTKRIYARMKGAWRAELRDSAGTLLASTDFVF